MLATVSVELREPAYTCVRKLFFHQVSRRCVANLHKLMVETMLGRKHGTDGIVEE